MKRPLHTIFTLFIFAFLNITQSSAFDCVANVSGDWNNPAIWSCGSVPTGGDVITIPAGVDVTISSTVFLAFGLPVTIIIEDGGTIIFNPPPCNGIQCAIQLWLASGSEIIADGGDAIILGPNANPGHTYVFLGGETVLHANGGFPFGPGMIPELGALPVELSAFSGKAMERTNLLSWQTASEENTMAFLIERSSDGRDDFEEINRVNAVGNSTTLQSYEIEDANPTPLAYYRLRIVDFDSTFELSEVIAVERTVKEIDLVEVYPNPAEEQVTVLVNAQVAGKATMILSDFMGRKIKEEKMELNPGVNRYTLNWDKHETNFYYLTIDNGNERIVKKILRASRN